MTDSILWNLSNESPFIYLTKMLAFRENIEEMLVSQHDGLCHHKDQINA